MTKTFVIEHRHDEIEVAAMLDRQPVSEAVNDILIELARAERIHPVMVGEAGEALRAALHLREGRLTEGGDSMVALRQEIIQTGAMALRALINLEGGE